jgi:cold shock CspA family protein
MAHPAVHMTPCAAHYPTARRYATYAPPPQTFVARPPRAPAATHPPAETAPFLVVGHIKHYRFDKAFGFGQTDTGEPVFFHRNALAPRALEALEERREGPLNVDMQVEMTDRGLRATFVGISRYDTYNAKPVRYL